MYVIELVGLLEELQEEDVLGDDDGGEDGEPEGHDQEEQELVDADALVVAGAREGA